MKIKHRSTTKQKNLSNNALHSRTEMARKRKREHYEEEWITMFRIYGYSLYFCNQVLVSSTGMQSYTNLHKSHLERASVSWKTALLWWELGFSGEHNDKMCLQTPQTQVRQVAKAPENPLISKLIWLNLPFLSLFIHSIRSLPNACTYSACLRWGHRPFIDYLMHVGHNDGRSILKLANPNLIGWQIYNTL